MSAATPKPRFSILIPTTGRFDLLEMSVRSVLSQSFGDFEIIIADSGDPRAGAEKIRSRDRRISYFNVMEAAKGKPHMPWDFAAKKAAGNYVLWLDDDNFLLNSALQIFNDEINKSGADIVTASHFYYYDKNHPRHNLRNSLGVIPYDKKRYEIEPKDLINAQFSFSKRGPGFPLPRFHSSSTIFSKRIIDQANARLGYVLITEMPINHSLHPILLSFAKTCVFIDIPVSIIGRLGVSMSQVWSTAAKKRFAREVFPVKLSPFSGHTKSNAILENYLRVKDLLPEKFADTPVDYDRFAEIYLPELFYLDADISTLINNWKNFFGFLKKYSPETCRRIKPKAIKLLLASPFVYISRRLKLHLLKRVIYGKVIHFIKKDRSSAEKFGGKREFEISLKDYQINSIEELSKKLPEIMLREFNAKIPN